MKKYFFIFYLCIQVNSVWACDACGASISPGYQGILPQFSRHFVGVRYQFRYFSSRGLADPNGAITNHEYFHSWNIYARLSPHKRVQVFINAPVNYYLQHDKGKGVVRDLAGPGDIWTYCQYQLIRTPDSSKALSRHLLMAGVGIKLPTGRYNLYDTLGIFDRNMQLGTGSWEALMGMNYTGRWNKWGLNIESNAKISTLNPDKYLYGHQVNLSTKGFYWGKVKNTSYLLSAGIQYDFRSRDHYLQQYLPTTGGHQLNLNASADVYVKKWVIGFDLRVSVFSKMGGGLIQPGLQLSTQILYMF